MARLPNLMTQELAHEHACIATVWPLSLGSALFSMFDDMKDQVMRSVVITGVSSGIGWAAAKLLLGRGFRVFGSVRKQADADRLKGEFGTNFTPQLFDITDEAAVKAAAQEVRAALNGETLLGLVNNAGIAVAGPVLELAADEFRRQMDVNVIGPIIATQAFGPLLG